MKIREMSLEELTPAVYNPRKDLKPGDKEYENLRKSIREFGYVEPIVMNERTGRVIGGHQRLKVLADLGYEKIQAVVVDIDEQKEKALNIALHKISGKWDEAKLKDLLIEIDTGEFDIELTGFDEKEIEKLMTKFDEVEERPELEFTEELLEEHNYVVLYFDNKVDWQTACEKLGIKSVQALDSREDYERKGIGRVIRGVDVLERIK